MIPEITMIENPQGGGQVMHQISSNLLNGQDLPDLMKIVFDAKVEARVKHSDLAKERELKIENSIRDKINGKNQALKGLSAVKSLPFPYSTVPQFSILAIMAHNRRVYD